MIISSFILLSFLGGLNAFLLNHPVKRKAGLTMALGNDYLSTLSGVTATLTPKTNHQVKNQDVSTINDKKTQQEQENVVTFWHAPCSYFAINKLVSKGHRKNADVGQPHDATRPLATSGPLSSGSWWCAAGGWPSPALRTTTEIFHVLEGRACVTDLDGMPHYFGPGDTVILPKGWSGRWDIMEPIHKIWFVHDHPNIELTSYPIRAIVTPYNNFAAHHLEPDGVRPDATHGTSPRTASRTIYEVGPTDVGCWTCTAGSFPSKVRTTTECFHVLEGVFFLTNKDGSARRCVAGDTIVLPIGWSGHWDVIETVKKIWVIV